MSNNCLILRSAEKARLEGRTTVTQLRVDDFDFDPPCALTAPRPASHATPLVCCSFPRSRRFEDRQIADLPASLQADDLLLFNDTKVTPAPRVGRRMLLDILCRGVRK
jgi:S-adenosylmethionine:tRNA-ribosyltransferase-isomerase (queuine synthetase)